MTTISLKLPRRRLLRLESASRLRGTTKSSLVRECLEKQLPEPEPAAQFPRLPRGKSCYDRALPILKRAWLRNRKLPRNLSTNSKYMRDFGA